jgi:hypothetical protein
MLRNLQNPIRPLAGGALCLCTAAAFAHDGHHAQHAGHWHATDLWGFVAIGLLVAAAVCQGRK